VIFPLTSEVAKTISDVPRMDVPDMPDRIIAATALHLDLPLISRDRKIRLSAVETLW
jgi:PIN domain nuclease of toxin-antitoxin system